MSKQTCTPFVRCSFSFITLRVLTSFQFISCLISNTSFFLVAFLSVYPVSCIILPAGVSAIADVCKMLHQKVFLRAAVIRSRNMTAERKRTE